MTNIITALASYGGWIFGRFRTERFSTTITSDSVMASKQDELALFVQKLLGKYEPYCDVDGFMALRSAKGNGEENASLSSDPEGISEKSVIVRYVDWLVESSQKNMRRPLLRICDEKVICVPPKLTREPTRGIIHKYLQDCADTVDCPWAWDDKNFLVKPARGRIYINRRDLPPAYEGASPDF